MTDIVERLREYNEPPFDYIAHEAAAKIEHLRLAWDTTSVRWGVTSAECNRLIIEIERLRIRNDKVKNKWKESTSQFKAWKRSFWSEERKAADKIETLTHELAKAKVEIERLRDEIYNLKLAVAGGEDAPGLANLVGLEDVIMWRKLWTDEIERLRGDKSVLITSFRINMMRLCPDYSHDEFDKDIAAMLKEKE